MDPIYRRVDSGATALCVLLGAWTLFAQAGVLAGLSCTTIRNGSFLPLLVAVAALRTIRRNQRVERSDPPPAPVFGARAPIAPALLFGSPVAIAALYAATRSEWLFWIPAAGYLALTAKSLRKPGGAEESPISSGSSGSAVEAGALLALCAVAALLTAGTVSPDADDAYYLNAASAVVGHPFAAPHSFDALHGGDFPPIQQTLHLAQVYELLVGLLALTFGLSVHALYYLVLPPLWAVAATLAHWLALRHLLSRRLALLATAVVVFVLATWGDGHRTFGGFGFARLFQGKSICVAVFVPLVVLAALKFRERPGVATWLGLALSQSVASGLSTSALIVAPLAAALALVAPPLGDRSRRRIALLGLAASAPLLIVGAGMSLRMAPYAAVAAVDPVLPGYPTALGEVRAPLVLLALLLVPALACGANFRGAEWSAGYARLLLFVVFLPAASRIAGRLAGSLFSWRLFWSVPVPLLLGLAGGLALAGGAARRGWRAAALAAWAAAFAVAGPTAVPFAGLSPRNWVRFKVPESQFAVAERMAELASPDALALAPESVAIYAAGLPGAPRLVAVRFYFLWQMRGFVPEAELSRRAGLLRYAGDPRSQTTLDEALAGIDAMNVGLVVFPESHRDGSELISALRERGFSSEADRGFVIAFNPRRANPASGGV